MLFERIEKMASKAALTFLCCVALINLANAQDQSGLVKLKIMLFFDLYLIVFTILS